MNTDALRRHACGLKHFLLSPWMKSDRWATMKQAIEDLTESIESYVLELVEKNRSVKRRNESSVGVASDDLSFHIVNVTTEYCSALKPLVEELESKDCYEPLFVRDFAPTDRHLRFTYIKHLEKGLPVKSVICTKSFGASVGNYHYIWKLPLHVSLENALSENQRIVSDIQ